MCKTVVVVEDEELIGEMLKLNLESEGFSVVWLADGLGVFEALRDNAAELLVLDVMLPSTDGFSVARSLRARGVGLPILMLTSLNDVANKLTGFDSGADDYLTKPFEMSELIARVRALLRRHETRK